MDLARKQKIASTSSMVFGITPIVYVVDDDVAVRQAIELLIRQCGWQPRTFVSAQDFLARDRVVAPSCLLLEVGLPDMNGLEVQERIADSRTWMPIIFITACRDVPTTAQAMKAGAAEFLTKPLRGDDLVTAMRDAIERSRAQLLAETEVQVLSAYYASLTTRERDVMALVASGLSNKAVGYKLGIYETTVKGHRAEVMRKMRADSLAELVSMAARLSRLATAKS